ncbi:MULTISPECIES: S26 family signal peptidase [unclassified Haloferax]|uniref:S26 family signal peptidase n=1 Tax=unclassified Haloferax TaxID=2625095 RepID=UPI0018F3DDB0|nr:MULTISPECIES: S26 family signal peptidase [unclassified Haloferax]
MSDDDGRPPSPEPRRGPASDEGVLTRLRTAEEGPLLFVREVLTSALAVLAVGLFLFAVSGVWPPMVAVESGSMEPHMHKGDLVFITGPDRYAPDASVEGTAVVTAETGAEVDYRKFGGPGSVIVYDDPGSAGPPIIHRAMFWVDEGENWYDRANPEYMSADNCRELANCPAEYAGFITKGDNNPRYDQVSGIADPVRPEWVQGVARVRIPLLGWVRLTLANSMATTTPVAPVSIDSVDSVESVDVTTAEPTVANVATTAPLPVETSKTAVHGDAVAA